MRSLLRLVAKLLLVSILASAALVTWLWPRYPYLPASTVEIELTRIGTGPILDASRLPVLENEAGRYGNVNFPTLIRVPGWVDDPLGTYYLYFSHHKGDEIRLAYADDVAGPWTLYEPGALRLAASGFPGRPATAADPVRAIADLARHFSPFVVRDYLVLNHRATASDRAIRAERGIAAAANRAPHIASPDLFVDEQKREIYMYYHGLEYGTRQLSRVARSGDGLHFSALDGTIPSPYLRSFAYRGTYYLLGMPGVLFRGPSPAGPFEARDRLLFEPRMRHAGLWLDGSTLFVFWSRVGDAPEALLMSEVDLAAHDWDDWRATAGREILRAESAWEGSELPELPSIRGELAFEANELRNPHVFADSDGRKYLLYVGRGEQAIGIARLDF